MSQKKTCSLIEDLLPLYVEGLVSEESKLEIEKHLEKCNRCSELLKGMKKENKLFLNEDVINSDTNSDREKKCIKNIKKKIIVKRIIAIVISIILTACIAYIYDTYRIMQDRDGGYVLYNTKTGNIKKGINATNVYVRYVSEYDEKEIEHNIILTFDKNDKCINARAVISGYEENELNNIKRSCENEPVKTNTKIENKKIYRDENVYVGRTKQNIMKSLKSYNAEVIEF